ncbi:MAG: MFS transporter [Spirochaetales bacterium]|nr:MFS transporter [Spirochaetales bacterium]
MGIKRTVILFPAAFLMNISIMMINFAVIFFLKDRVQLSPSVIGLYFAAGSVGYAGLCLALRPVQDRIAPPVSMVISIALTIFSLLMMKSTTNPYVVFIYYFIFAAAPAFYWPQVMGWFSYGLNHDELGTAVSRFNISWSTGSLCGPLIGGFIASYDIMLSFYIDLAIIGFIGIILVFGLIFIKDMKEFPRAIRVVGDGPSTHATGLAPDTKKDDLINNGEGTFLRFPGWIGVFSTYIVLGMINNIFPLYIRDSLNLNETVAGNLLFVRGLVTALGFGLLGKFVNWHFNKKIMLITQGSTVLILILLLFVKSVFLFYFLFIIYGLLFSMAYSNGIFHGSAGAEARGKRMALFESFLTTGTVIGTIIGGYLYQFLSIQIAFALAAVLVLAGFIVQSVMMKFADKHNLK